MPIVKYYTAQGCLAQVIAVHALKYKLGNSVYISSSGLVIKLFLVLYYDYLICTEKGKYQ